MSNYKQSIENILTGYLVLLNNALGNPFVMAEFEKRGITRDKLLRLKSEVETIQNLRKKQTLSKAEKSKVSQDADLLFDELFKFYRSLIKMGKINLTDDIYATKLLELESEKSETISEFINYGIAFYENLIELLKVNEKYIIFGLKEVEINDEIVKIKKLSTLNEEKTQDTGNSIQSTADKDEQLEKTDKEMSKLIASSKVIFADYPAILKSLGIKK